MTSSNRTWGLAGAALVLALGVGLLVSACSQPEPIVGVLPILKNGERTVKQVREKTFYVVLPGDGKSYSKEFSHNSTVTVGLLLP